MKQETSTPPGVFLLVAGLALMAAIGFGIQLCVKWRRPLQVGMSQSTPTRGHVIPLAVGCPRRLPSDNQLTVITVVPDSSVRSRIDVAPLTDTRGDTLVSSRYNHVGVDSRAITWTVDLPPITADRLLVSVFAVSTEDAGRSFLDIWNNGYRSSAAGGCVILADPALRWVTPLDVMLPVGFLILAVTATFLYHHPLTID